MASPLHGQARSLVRADRARFNSQLGWSSELLKERLMKFFSDDLLQQRIFNFRTMFVLAVFSCLFLVHSKGAPAAQIQKHVLLIYESRSDMLANVIIDRAIRKALSEKFSVDLDIYSEYFETSPSMKEDFPLLLSWLRRKYAGRRFDVVIPVGATSLQLVRECGDELFRGAEVVYLGRRSGLDNWGLARRVTGVVAPQMEDQVKATFGFIRTLQPDLQQLIVVTGTDPTDIAWEQAARSELRPFESQLEITHLSGLSLEKLQTEIGRLPTNSAVLFLSLGEDGAGRRLLRTQVLGQVAQAAAAPVYFVSALYLDTGILGGKLLDQEAMAGEVAELASRLLSGEDIRSIPVQQSSLVPMVNWRALKRWGLDEKRLPPDTVIRYRDPSAWDLYKWRILGIVSLCLIECGLIVALLAQRSNRRRAETAVLEGKRLLQATIDALNARVALLDESGTIIAVNQPWKAFTQANRHEKTVRDIGFNYLEACVAHPLCPETQMVSKGIQQLKSDELDEFRCIYPSRQSNATFWFQIRITRFEMYGAARMVVTYEDVTEIKEAHDAQQKLSGLLMQAQDDERRRIARELHDSTVQNLVALKADVTGIEKEAKHLSPDATEMLQESVSLCNQAIRELRTLSYLLHPPFLDEAGLVPALTWFVRGFIQRSGIPVELMVVDEIGRLPTDVETALFRVVQESLTNIHRHSGGGRAVIWVTREKDNVALRIMDDGHGFSLPATEDNLESAVLPGVGIPGMRQRLRQLGGQLEIESGPHGTTVNAKICLSEDRHHAYLTR
jgi:two-component system, NarL family, sensor kinase